MLVVIRGAGDLASGIALRLLRSGIRVVMTDLERPLAIRRSVAFCEANRLGEITIETLVVSSLCRSQNPQVRGVFSRAPSWNWGPRRGAALSQAVSRERTRSVGNGLSPVQAADCGGA